MSRESGGESNVCRVTAVLDKVMSSRMVSQKGVFMIDKVLSYTISSMHYFIHIFKEHYYPIKAQFISLFTLLESFTAMTKYFNSSPEFL